MARLRLLRPDFWFGAAFSPFALFILYNVCVCVACARLRSTEFHSTIARNSTAKETDDKMIDTTKFFRVRQILETRFSKNLVRTLKSARLKPDTVRFGVYV